jgi:hypothetical protein
MLGGMQRSAQAADLTPYLRELRTGIGLVVACVCEADRVELLLVERHD